MNKVLIKEKKEDSFESDSIALSSSSSNRSSTLSISSPPTQLVSPSTLIFGEGGTSQETELLYKVKKLLCLVITFGQDISAIAGDSVRKNVTSLVVSIHKEYPRNLY
jgi:hypothetical protein